MAIYVLFWKKFINKKLKINAKYTWENSLCKNVYVLAEFSS